MQHKVPKSTLLHHDDVGRNFDQQAQDFLWPKLLEEFIYVAKQCLFYDTGFKQSAIGLDLNTVKDKTL